MFKNRLTILLMMLIVLVWSVGCGGSNIYDLSNFVIPDNEEFLTIINELNTPKKICHYMETDFVYQITLGNSYSPYQMWLLNRAGDCNDYSNFAVFVADYHGYKIYQILVYYYDLKYSHMLGVFIEGKFTYSDVWVYHPIQVDTFEEIVNHHCKHSNRELKSYIVYDYDMQIIEEMR